ncbi:MAG: exodeoxyribonuclease V subunit alpha [Proteobacteria bacterium]|nr:MAG: exodeoxyribonuclease V subunit alpha [Pseudomonadota bacterium]
MTEALAYSRLDQAIASFLTERSDLDDAQQHDFRQIVLDLSAAQSAGHSCLPVDAAQQTLLSQSPLVSLSANTPLILEDGRLYLQRYWQYESRLVSNIQQRIQRVLEKPAQLEELLEKYFPSASPAPVLAATANDAAEDEVDWQKEAASSCAQQAFSMITGGPGTGKTTTVLKILALLQELHHGKLSIALAAPTGKAAMRLQQSLREGKQHLPALDATLQAAIPETVSTLHRLLGPIHQSTQFRHHAGKPLSCDVLVVDEASMIDLALMSKLVDALHPQARLILLGDQDQLASVESGAVLGDLCASLPNQTLQLKKTWRFSGPIKALATAVNQQQPRQAWQILQDDAQQVANVVEGDPVAYMQEHYQAYFQQIKHSSDPKAALTTFSQFQVLAALRQGVTGVEGLNLALEKRLQAQEIATYRTWYHGRPVMISRNDPALGLFNGDIGLCLYDAERDQMRVWFEQADGQMRAVMPGRLPAHETVYAMTIHKSQGSEFPHVMIVLPEHDNPLLSGELLYTAITRAKAQVDIAALPAVFMKTVQRRVQRQSGLQVKMRKAFL